MIGWGAAAPYVVAIPYSDTDLIPSLPYKSFPCSHLRP
jgi:hypothetical protein